MSDSASPLINRQTSRDERVSFAEPVVLSSSRRSRKTFVPFFIHHTNGPDELAIKIITEVRKPPPQDWEFDEEHTISLKGNQLRILQTELSRHLAIANERDGQYLVVELGGRETDVSSLPPESVAQSIMAVLSQPTIVAHLGNLDIGAEISRSLHQAIHINEMRNSVAALRANLDGGVDDEATYQRWCESHNWAFGNAYYTQDQIRQVTSGDRVDLLLASNLTGMRDVVELKRPSFEVLHFDQSHRSYYFSSEVGKAIGQCHRYLDLLHETARNGLLDHPEIVAYHPQAIIVIGRSREWTPEKVKALHGLNQRLHGIKVMTYDHLLSQGERILDHILPPDPIDSGPEDDSLIPF